MNIISIVRQKLSGIHLYRGVVPHSYMSGRHNVKEMRFTDTLIKMSDEELSKFDMVHVSYHDWDVLETKRLNDLGVKLVIDVDDYWRLSRFHEFYDQYEEQGTTEKIIETIKCADAITTTTDLLAEKIKPFNKTVGVFGNALMNDEYYQPTKNEIPVAAWLGAAQHTADMMMIQHLRKGFKIPVFIPEQYKQVFNDKFDYYTPVPVPEYLSLYNKFDIILAPLRKDEFNKYKSPLKVMEAGFFSKPLIVSDVDPFSPYLKHKENCLVVRKKSEWGRFLKLMANDKAMRDELGRNLHKDVLKDFDLAKITKARFEYYKKIIS